MAYSPYRPDSPLGYAANNSRLLCNKTRKRTCQHAGLDEILSGIILAFMQRNIIIIVIISLQALLGLASCAPARGNVYPLSQGYIREDSLYKEITRISSLQPALAQVRIIGFSGTENSPLYALEIGRKQATRKALLIGQHHGDEVLGVNVSLAFAEHLLTEPACRKILQNCSLWIVPSLNPEGYRIVSSGQFQFKRKNNRDTDGNKRLDLRTDGVDLNRNYPVFWDLDPDTNPQSPYFKGAEPASERETQAIISLAQQQEFYLAIFLHSSASGAYSEKLYLPARGNGSDLYQQTQALAQSYAQAVKRDYQRGYYEVHTGPSSEVGNARNYFFHRLGSRAFLVEIGGINKLGQSIIHPPDRILKKIVQKQVRALTKIFLELSAEIPDTPKSSKS